MGDSEVGWKSVAVSILLLTGLIQHGYQCQRGNIMSQNKTNSACESVLRKLSAGDFDDWSGLPSQCKPADLAAVLSGGERAANGILSNQPTNFRVYQAPNQSEVIQAWFDDDDNVLLITIVSPFIKGDVKALLERFGPPEKKLEQGVGYHADAHQWIYASRGITFYVREHSNEIARVAVYPPTSVEDYINRLGARDQKRYWPMNQR
jgi:hypothetical protein